MQKTLRVATYNIAHCLNFSNFHEPLVAGRDLPITLHETAAIIRELNADLVGVNEIYESGWELLVEQPKRIAQSSGKPYWAFGEAICFSSNQPARYGNAMLSDWEILSQRVVKVPSPVGDERREGENGYYEDRAVLCTEVNVDGLIITMLVTHFGLNPLETERMVDALVKIIDETKTPIVLTGDFNLQPHAPVLQPIYDRLQSVAEAVGNTDFTFSSYEPSVVIDYIFVSKEFTPCAFDVLDRRVSDHRPCVATVTYESPVTKTTPFLEKGEIKMIAHRGVSGLERENTCPAFVAAGVKSYYGIETDVHVTKDGRFIVVHDDDLRRVAGLDMSVEESTFADLRKVRLTDTDGVTVREDLFLPSLDEYVSICKKYDKQAVLELKNEIPQEKVWEIAESIRRVGWFERTTFISFYKETLLALRAKYPEADAQFLTESIDEEIVRFMTDNRLDADLYGACVTKEVVDRLHAAGLKVNCWTLDSIKHARLAKACGVDMITSNILE